MVPCLHLEVVLSACIILGGSTLLIDGTDGKELTDRFAGEGHAQGLLVLCLFEHNGLVNVAPHHDVGLQCILELTEHVLEGGGIIHLNDKVALPHQLFLGRVVVLLEEAILDRVHVNRDPVLQVNVEAKGLLLGLPLHRKLELWLRTFWVVFLAFLDLDPQIGLLLVFGVFDLQLSVESFAEVLALQLCNAKLLGGDDVLVVNVELQVIPVIELHDLALLKPKRVEGVLDDLRCVVQRLTGLELEVAIRLAGAREPISVAKAPRAHDGHSELWPLGLGWRHRLRSYSRQGHGLHQLGLGLDSIATASVAHG
mmetsp:Transcript_150458/g.419213  ORF Transcript_150458/g.419213 Transcript_150458/m.419213 type:complete len:311 (-) Transcript_150458:49-981(-)